MSVVYIALMIGGLIFFHELGHYLVARWMGVHVVEFSIGFGPRVFNFKQKQTRATLPPTEWSIALLPVGGFVKMLGADPMEDVPAEIRDVALNFKPVWRRFLIALAGPLFNLILPFIIFFFVGLGTSTAPSSVMGDVNPGGPAWAAGIRPGDRITAVGGEEVRTWGEFSGAVQEYPDKDVEIRWDRLGEAKSAIVHPVAETRDIIPNVMTETQGRVGVTNSFGLSILHIEPGSPAEKAGLRDLDAVVTVNGQRERYLYRVLGLIEASPEQPITLGVLSFAERSVGGVGVALATPRTITLPPAVGGDPLRGIRSGACVVSRVSPRSPAAKAGLRTGDRITSYDGWECASWLFAANYLEERRGKAVKLTWERGGEQLAGELAAAQVPWPAPLQPDRKVYFTGLDVVLGSELPDDVEIDDRFGFAVGYMADRSFGAMIGTLAVLGGLFSGKVSIKDGLAGPAMIMRLTADAAEQGAEQFFKLMAMLSVSLGLINLLPIPVLDGGQILFLAIEGVRRKPVSMRLRMVATYIGLAFIVVLMVVVLRNDIDRCAGIIGLW
ncbi:MAG: site-2 protease family protein [Myxococcales bacterium]|nr:site-2 protease family protein [Myxococcales bacterium]MCB9731369.1 site-2 protease family protein [Deltaproteobacteria bacterium]